ncbi:MAG TPA: hypothetical protein VFZ58_05700 [Candidatus Saccharimonadales bacterium]
MPANLLKKWGALLRPSLSKRAIKAFAKRFDLVYFGHIDHRYDEHAVIRGVTASAHHIDNHFAVGTLKGRDMSVLERTNTLRFPGKPASEYTWIILQIDLSDGLELPHIFIDAFHHDELFYANLFVNFANFQLAQSLFVHHDPLFHQHFKVYVPTDKFDDVAALFDNETTSMLAHHFTKFDYEIEDNILYVYASNQYATERDIEQMARIGLWLANKLEAQASHLQSLHQANK